MFYSEGERFFTQSQLCSVCSVSPGAVCRLVGWLEQIGAVERRPQGFRLVDPHKILISWAVKRNLMEDVKYCTHVPSIAHAEELLSKKVVFTAHSAYKRIFREDPGYDRLFVYGRPSEVKQMFPSRRGRRNLFVLPLDEHLSQLSEGGKVPLVQLYVDLWQLGATKLLERVELELEQRRLSALGKMMAPPLSS